MNFSEESTENENSVFIAFDTKVLSFAGWFSNRITSKLQENVISSSATITHYAVNCERNSNELDALHVTRYARDISRAALTRRLHCPYLNSIMCSVYV